MAGHWVHQQHQQPHDISAVYPPRYTVIPNLARRHAARGRAT